MRRQLLNESIVWALKTWASRVLFSILQYSATLWPSMYFLGIRAGSRSIRNMKQLNNWVVKSVSGAIRCIISTSIPANATSLCLLPILPIYPTWLCFFPMLPAYASCQYYLSMLPANACCQYYQPMLPDYAFCQCYLPMLPVNATCLW